MIHMARENARRAGLSDRLSFEFGNSSRLRFKDDKFEMVLSTGMLHSLKHPVKVFNEIYRVLKKGGEAWIYDPAKVALYIDRNKWEASLSSWDRLFLRLFRALGLLRPIKTYNPSQVREMLDETEFEVLSIEAQKDEIRIKLRK